MHVCVWVQLVAERDNCDDHSLLDLIIIITNLLGDADDCQVEVISVGFTPSLSTVLQKLELQQQK